MADGGGENYTGKMCSRVADCAGGGGEGQLPGRKGRLEVAHVSGAEMDDIVKAESDAEPFLRAWRSQHALTGGNSTLRARPTTAS